MFESWQLIFYGTETPPVNLKDKPVRRTKIPVVPTTSVTVSKNTSVTDKSRPSISDNNTMLNVSRVETVESSTVSAFNVTEKERESSGNFSSVTQVVVVNKENVTAELINTTTVVVNSTASLVTEVWSKFSQPDIVTTTQPVTETESGMNNESAWNTAWSTHPSTGLDGLLTPTHSNPVENTRSINCTVMSSGNCDNRLLDPMSVPYTTTVSSTVTLLVESNVSNVDNFLLHGGNGTNVTERAMIDGISRVVNDSEV